MARAILILSLLLAYIGYTRYESESAGQKLNTVKNFYTSAQTQAGAISAANR